MYERAFIQSKIAKKRASQDSITREQRSNNSFKGNKKGMAQVSIDLQTKKNLLSLNNSNNNTYRQRNHQTNLSQLREQVQQLRMQNQSLREQIKAMKDKESQLKYDIRKINEKFVTEKRQLARKISHLQQKNVKYSQKIKQLFQTLIQQKKKKTGHLEDSVKLNSILSPSSKSANYSQSFPYQQFQRQGEVDYYKSIQQSRKFPYHSNRQQQPETYIPQTDDHLNIFHSHGGYMRGETFGTHH